MDYSNPMGSQVSVAVAGVTHEEGKRRDVEFYFAMVVFLVDGCLFKVPRLYFEKHSEIFQTMFTLPAGDQGVQEGSCDENPLRLDGVSEADFRLLLKVLYPIQFDVRPTLTKEEWVSILKLAHMWGFERVRSLSVTELSKCSMEEVEKVVLARTYDVTEWFMPAYAALVKREQPLSVEEVERLGIDFVVKLAHARELEAKGILVNQAQAGSCGYCGRNYNTYGAVLTRASADTATIVRQVFGFNA